LDIVVYTDEGAFTSLRDAWHGLLSPEAGHSVFSTPEWLATWWRAFSQGRPLHLLTAWQDGRLAGIAPLMQSIEDGQRCRCFIGGLDVSDYFDLLALPGHEETFLSAFLDHLEADPDWDVVDLHSVPAGSPTLARLPEMARSRGYSVSVSQEEVCPIVELPGSWDAYLNSLGKKDRHELRRKLRRMEGVDWSWRTVTGDGDLPGALGDFFDLHAKSSAGKANFWDEERRGFFVENAAAMQRAGWLRLSFLEIGGARVATLFAYDYQGTVGLYNSGYDPAFGYYSVGVLLVAMGIQDAIAAGRKRFDFLRGNEPYKYDFGACDTPVHNLVISRDDRGRRG
jgi:CelD/BcsL family acetyltransferase involved in cellulose biosynthesis